MAMRLGINVLMRMTRQNLPAPSGTLHLEERHRHRLKCHAQKPSLRSGAAVRSLTEPLGMLGPTTAPRTPGDLPALRPPSRICGQRQAPTQNQRRTEKRIFCSQEGRAPPGLPWPSTEGQHAKGHAPTGEGRAFRGLVRKRREPIQGRSDSPTTSGTLLSRRPERTDHPAAGQKGGAHSVLEYLPSCRPANRSHEGCLESEAVHAQSRQMCCAPAPCTRPSSRHRALGNSQGYRPDHGARSVRRGFAAAIYGACGYSFAPLRAPFEKVPRQRGEGVPVFGWPT